LKLGLARLRGTAQRTDSFGDVIGYCAGNGASSGASRSATKGAGPSGTANTFHDGSTGMNQYPCNSRQPAAILLLVGASD
jgi:hypothetical protein